MQVQTYATEKLLSDKTQAVERDRQLSDTQHLSVLSLIRMRRESNTGLLAGVPDALPLSYACNFDLMVP